MWSDCEKMCPIQKGIQVQPTYMIVAHVGLAGVCRDCRPTLCVDDASPWSRITGSCYRPAQTSALALPSFAVR